MTSEFKYGSWVLGISGVKEAMLWDLTSSKVELGTGVMRDA